MYFWFWVVVYLVNVWISKSLKFCLHRLYVKTTSTLAWPSLLKVMARTMNPSEAISSPSVSLLPSSSLVWHHTPFICTLTIRQWYCFRDQNQQKPTHCIKFWTELTTKLGFWNNVLLSQVCYRIIIKIFPGNNNVICKIKFSWSVISIWQKGLDSNTTIRYPGVL